MFDTRLTSLDYNNCKDVSFKLDLNKTTSYVSKFDYYIEIFNLQLLLVVLLKMKL